MNSTLSILIIISIVIVGYLIYKSKKNKKIGNSSNFISYTYNRPKHSNNFDHSSSYSSSDSCSSSDSSSSCSD